MTPSQYPALPGDPALPAPAAAPAGDPVLAALGGLGAAVDTAGERSLPLEGPHVLWLVAEGALDLFAVDAAWQGRWHFLGRLEAGTLLLGPPDGPRHTLLGRPLQGCVLRRIALRELPAPPTGYGYGYDPGYAAGYGYGYGYGDDTGEWPRPVLPSPLDQAFAHGIGRGLRVLFGALLGSVPQPGGEFGAGPDGQGAWDDGIQWMDAAPGSLAYGAPDGPQAVCDLLIDAAMWQRAVDQYTRLMTGLDRWIERLESAHEERAAAGIRAGEAVKAQADRALLASIDRSGAARRSAERDGDAALAACRRVAQAARITLAAPAGGSGPDGRSDPVERIAVGARLRTRQVKLGGRWWRADIGPLVGYRAGTGTPVALLWRRGRYEAVDAAGRRTRVTAAAAAGFEPRAVMLYRPLPDEPLPLWRLLRFAMRGTGGDLRSLVVAGLVAVTIGALVPVATGQVLGVYVPKGDSGLIVDVSLAVVVATVVTAAFSLMENVSLLRIEGRIEAALQPAVWDRLLRLPTRFFAGRSTGELASAALGVSAIRRVLSGISSVLVQSSTVGAVNFAVLLSYSPPLALVALAMLVVVAVVFLGLGLLQLRWQRRLTALTNKLGNQAFQTLRGLPKLRVAAAESFAYAAWAREFARSRELQQRVGRIRNLITVFNAVYLPLCTLVVFALVAGPARGALSPSGFLAFNSAVAMMLASVTQLTGALLSAASVLPLYEQLKPVLDEMPEVRGGSTVPGALSGAIEARGVSFRYGADQPLVLDEVSFRVSPGEFVAITGASGCGKSTLLRLLIGFERPSSGSVLYDGQDLAALDQGAVRRQCGVVLQNAQPLTGSILEAICGSETFTIEEAWQAAEMAGLAEDIKRMPMGMHTVLADGGGTISGGQRQRLMIAQALIRRPRILFLDEATSALDNETQRLVIESTRALNSTRIVIAHRLSTVMDADRVIVMEQGRVIQQGPPAELLADRGGLFHELVRRQIS